MDLNSIFENEHNEIENLNLDEYDFIAPTSIEIIKSNDEKFIDITVKDDNSFYVYLENSNTVILSKNCDGAHIRALYIAFFSKYAPSIIKEGRLCCLQLPLICMKDNKGNIIEMFQTFDEYNNWLKDNKNSKLECKYFKGLGSWKDKEIKDLVKKYGVEKFIEPLELDKDSFKLIDDWVGKKNSEIRKTYLKENEFSIFSM